EGRGGRASEKSEGGTRARTRRARCRQRGAERAVVPEARAGHRARSDRSGAGSPGAEDPHFVSDGRELESRVERLELALQAIDSRLAKLEHRPHHEARPAPSAPAEPAESEAGALGLFGITMLILGGAFVLRALTESNVLPRLTGAILGLAYAGVWIWNADRLARRHHARAALFHAVTAAVIAFPLLWETTVRFHILPAMVASIAVGLLDLLFLWIAVRGDQQALAWTGSLAAILAAFSIGPS